MSRNKQIGAGGRKAVDGTREDRRIQRTRQALHQALITLVLEKGYEAVSITDIVERANVGRSTFYAHYPSKEDLLTAEMTELRALLTARQRAALARTGTIAERSLGFSLAFFEHAQDYRDIYRALVGERGAAIMINRIRTLLTELVRQDLAEIIPATGKQQVPRAALVQFVVGALMSMLTWWLDHKSNLRPAEVDTIFRRLVTAAITGALE
ncbi:MAG: TetR/AcrR family transcriptional regulator [Alphaproteobacteria bacterium]|nr:TetR/AcrR family transcriptional regulator [Alphaproteobacteria bacterium]MDE2629912.1 TetR/AcrR family transcriptional regulator [Alphaproteobacteria bacterium]